MDSHPDFFKIVLAHTLSDKELSLPPRFLSEYGDLFSTTVLLKLPNDKEWRVELRRENGRAWLQKGWQEFAEYSSLDVGHLVVFKFDRDSFFHVSIFDMSGFAIKYPCNYETGFSRKSENSRVARKKRLKRKVEDRTANTSAREEDEHRPHFHHSPKEQAPKLASMNPYFRVVIHLSHANDKCYLNIPTNFVKSYLNAYGIKHRGEAVLQASDGKKWVSKLYPRSQTCRFGMRISCKTFMMDNNVEVGDVCVFELIKDVKVLFNVLIFRFSKAGTNHCEELESKLNRFWPKRDPKYKLCSSSTALDASQSYRKSLTTNPFFEILIRSYNFHHGHVKLPAKLNKLVKEAERTKLVVGDGAWLVKLNRHESKVSLSAGWTAFAKDNWLKVDDVCIFELIDEKDSVLKVHIFRS